MSKELEKPPAKKKSLSAPTGALITPVGAPRKTSKWPLGLVGGVAAAAAFFWLRNVSSADHAMMTGWQLSRSAADVLEAVAVVVFLTAIEAFVVRIIRDSKATPKPVATNSPRAKAPPRPSARVADASASSPKDATPDVAAALRKLADLRDQGLITESDFAAKKEEILRRL